MQVTSLLQQATSVAAGAAAAAGLTTNPTQTTHQDSAPAHAPRQATSQLLGCAYAWPVCCCLLEHHHLPQSSSAGAAALTVAGAAAARRLFWLGEGDTRGGVGVVPREAGREPLLKEGVREEMGALAAGLAGPQLLSHPASPVAKGTASTASVS
jgi:hypothetical protein